MTTGELEGMSKSGNPHRRIAAARHIPLPPETQWELAKDPYPPVRLALSENPDLLDEVRTALANDQNPEVAAAAQGLQFKENPAENDLGRATDNTPPVKSEEIRGMASIDLDAREVISSLERLSALLDDGRITQSEYQALKASILGLAHPPST